MSADGGLYMATSMDPVFLLLPILEAAAAQVVDRTSPLTAMFIVSLTHTLGHNCRAFWEAFLSSLLHRVSACSMVLFSRRV